MHAEFRYRGGAMAGQVRVVRKDFATIGRHHSADVPFDARRDLDVSGRHAAVFRQGEAWVVRDLGSTNGTWVNGERIRGDRILAPGDLLRFGKDGPELCYQPVPAMPAAADEAAARADQAVTVVPAAAKRKERTSERIRVEVRRQTAGWKRVAVAALMVGGLALGGLGVMTLSRNRALAAQRTRLLGQTDSLIGNLAGASSSVAQLSAELEEARRETARLRIAIADQATGHSGLDSLELHLAGTGNRQAAVLRAARLDLRAIDSAGADAAAVVVSELPGRRWVSGSGFAIRTRGDTGWVVTARHLVADSTGRLATRLGVVFHGSGQTFRAEIETVDDSAELAILMVRVRGGVPALGPGSGELRAGDAVAILGFPAGLDPAGRWRSEGVRAVGFSGTVKRAGPDRIEIDGYGVNGSSGSPVLNAAGEVAGVVYGGDPASGGRYVYAVPARRLAALLARLGLSP